MELMKTITLTTEQLAARGITRFVHGEPLFKPESALAHKYLDGLHGIEIGPAAYQPFGLDSIGVTTADPKDRELYRGIELIVCGAYVEIDWYAEADDLKADSDSQDFVLSSHVLEHTPNPIKCFLEWNRVVKDGGYVYMIVPKRENPYGDEGRVITPLIYFYRAYYENWTLDQAFEGTPDKSSQPRHRCHYWVFNLESMNRLIDYCNMAHFINWQLLEAHETDDKDGEGHMFIYRKAAGDNE